MSDYISQVTIPVEDSTQTYDVKELFPHYAQCSTAANVADKEVTIGNFTLYTGSWLVIKFTITNSADVASLTLNVDGTGKKNIKYRNANLSYAGQLVANRYYLLMYDGTYYQVIGDLDTNNYDRTSIQTKIYAGGVGVKKYSIVGLNSDQRMESFTTTSGTGTTKEFNTTGKFLYPPTIMYNSTSSDVAAGTALANNVLYEQYPNADMRYSCNITTSVGFTLYVPVYLECSFDGNGLWSPTSTGFTQTFTSGRYYILIGCSYSTSIYQLALFVYNPMFYYDGTNLVSCDYTRGNTITTTIGSATAGQVIPADDITAWDAGSVPSLSVTTYTVPNVSGSTDVSIPNVTENTSVTVKSVKTADTPTTAKISAGVLTITKGTSVVTEDKTATNTTLGTNISASKVTLGNAFSIKGVNEWDEGSLPSLSYTAKSIPNISVTDVTNVLKKK